MCLAVPGKIIATRTDVPGAEIPVATVDFQGSQVDVSLAFTPGARVGDWVLVHAGFALNVLDAEEAKRTWEYLKEAEAGESEIQDVRFQAEMGESETQK